MIIFHRSHKFLEKWQVIGGKTEGGERGQGFVVLLPTNCGQSIHLYAAQLTRSVTPTYAPHQV